MLLNTIKISVNTKLYIQKLRNVSYSACQIHVKCIVLSQYTLYPQNLLGEMYIYMYETYSFLSLVSLIC